MPSLNGLDKLGGPDLEATGQFDNIEQADVPSPALHPTHMVPVQVGQLRQLFLRQVTL
jgi:hypothetical protein